MLASAGDLLWTGFFGGDGDSKWLFVANFKPEVVVVYQRRAFFIWADRGREADSQHATRELKSPGAELLLYCLFLRRSFCSFPVRAFGSSSLWSTEPAAGVVGLREMRELPPPRICFLATAILIIKDRPIHHTKSYKRTEARRN